ncbi:MAG: GerW family sporulation protein [Oscillospiraceae bacterium]|nr:GerW family sporulation protein [Oscillospiraceae bacterium]
MSEKTHPINDLMGTTLEKIQDMVKANAIVGQPITTPDGVTLIPVSKLSFGFASGGSDFIPKNHKAGDSNTFGGGAGAGVNITPVAFLIVRGESVRLLSVDPPAANTVDRVIDAVPEVVDKVTDFLNKRKQDGQSEFG